MQIQCVLPVFLCAGRAADLFEHLQHFLPVNHTSFFYTAVNSSCCLSAASMPSLSSSHLRVFLPGLSLLICSHLSVAACFSAFPLTVTLLKQSNTVRMAVFGVANKP